MSTDQTYSGSLTRLREKEQSFTNEIQMIPLSSAEPSLCHWEAGERGWKRSGDDSPPRAIFFFFFFDRWEPLWRRDTILLDVRMLCVQSET